MSFVKRKANNHNFLIKSFNWSNYTTTHLIYDFGCLIYLHTHLQQTQIHCY